MAAGSRDSAGAGRAGRGLQRVPCLVWVPLKSWVFMGQAAAKAREGCKRKFQAGFVRAGCKGACTPGTGCDAVALKNTSWLLTEHGTHMMGSMDLTSQPCSLKDDSINLKVTDHSGAQIDEIDNLKEELEKWKERLEKAEKQKDELLLLKLSADGKRDQTQDELRKLMDLEEEQCKESMIKKENQERNLTVVKQQNIELRREIQKLKDDLAAKSSKLSQDFRIKREIPKKKMKFIRMENAESDDTFLNTCCLFHIAAKIPFRLQQRQALLTFEEEDVAQKLIRRDKHTVSLDNEKIELKAMPVTLETGVKFELHVTISGEKINVSEVPHLPIPDEWIRDKIELNFYKSKQGGGEVKDVRYDRRSRTAIITFLKPGDIFWDFQEDHTVVRNPRG
ncbi:N-myc-interactor isoform X2 [Chrysemys picta bellii]|uniref:N-myc-interactor isoform X2 n=1 Tax=Chrysemys picta bellii TaxID=8478 RepID=UPI0032B0F331